jgi:hypothetical protein
MSFVFRLEDYARYLERVGEATYIDVTRRTDPARIQRVWDNLSAVVEAYSAPWIVQLWTKDAAGTLARGGSLLQRLLDEGTTLAAQITVTGLSGSIWEPLTPSKPFAGVADLVALLGGPEHVKWRYDPIIPTVHCVARFRGLACQAAALGITCCVKNFLAPPGHYKRVDARLNGVLPGWSEGMPGYDDKWRAEAAAQLVEAAGDFGLAVAVCAESAGLAFPNYGGQLPLNCGGPASVDCKGQACRVPGLQPAACGDYDWFVALSGRDPGRVPTSGSRPGCGCAAYIDVGLYGQRQHCHQCLYCYAG